MRGPIEERVVEVRVRGAADAIAAYRAIGRAGDDAAAGSDHLTRSAHRSREEVTRLGREGHSAMASLRSGARMAAGAITAIAGATTAVLASQAVSLAAQRDSQIKGLTALMGSADAAAAHFRELQRVAALPGVTLTGALELSQKFQSVGLEAGLAVKAVEELGNAVALTGGSEESLGRAALAIQQIVSNGRVMGEEINQLAEAIPQVRKVLKDTFGTSSSEELRAMGIASEDLVRILIDGFSSLPRAELNTFSNQLQNLKMAAQELLIAFGKGFTGSEGVGGLQVLASVLERLTPAAESFGAAVARALPGVIQFLERLADGTVYAQIQTGLLAVRVAFADMVGQAHVLLRQAGATVKWFGGMVAAVMQAAGQAVVGFAGRLKPALFAALEAMRAWAKGHLLAILNPRALLANLEQIKATASAAFSAVAQPQRVGAEIAAVYQRSLADLRAELSGIASAERDAAAARQDALTMARASIAMRLAETAATRQQTTAVQEQTAATRGLASAQAEVADMLARQARVRAQQAQAYAAGEMTRRDQVATAAASAVSGIIGPLMRRVWQEAQASVARGEAVGGALEPGDRYSRTVAEYQRRIGGSSLDRTAIDRRIAEADLRAQRLKDLGDAAQAETAMQEVARLREWADAMSAAWERQKDAALGAAGAAERYNDLLKRRAETDRQLAEQVAEAERATRDAVQAAEQERLARADGVAREARRISIMMRGGGGSGRPESFGDRLTGSIIGNLGGGVDTILAEARLRGLADGVTRAVVGGMRGYTEVITEAIRDGVEAATRQAAGAARRAVAAA